MCPSPLPRLALAALFGLTTPAAAQQEQVVSQVDLRDGGSLFGHVIERGERVRVVVGSDTFDLPASRVEQVREVRGQVIDGRFMRLDPNETRLFFGPTARTMPAGDAYLGIFELYLPFLAYGLTDRFTLAGGVPLVFAAEMPVILYVAPKLQVLRSDAVTAAIGSLSFFSEGESLGIVYGVATFEAPDGMASATLGGGMPYSDEFENEAVLMFGGDLRVSRSLKLLSENYVLAGEGALFSAGLRFIGERLSADVGLAVPSGESIALPVVNFVYSF